MPAHFDDESSQLELSVGDLLGRESAASIGFGNRGGYERLWLGQAIHSRYQEQALAADSSYRREVTLSVELVHRGWAVVIKGRADGLRREDDGTLVIEEIKSVRRGGHLAPATREAYAKQALVYAWMLHRQGEEKVTAELLLIEIGGDSVEREPLEVRFRALEGEIKRRLSALIRAHEAHRVAAAERRALAAELPFPHPEARPGQSEIIDSVATALEQRDHLLVEAPTGIGKTIAALYPALKYALSHDKRVFVLTAKTLQQEMAMKVLRLLNPTAAYHSMRLRAKAKMCANGEVICHEEYCPYARDYYAKVRSSGVIGRILDEYSSIEPDLIYRQAEKAEVCPFEISLDLAHTAQVVVCDYNYAFGPYVALSDFGEEADLSEAVLVIDEIHNLVDRGRGYYSPSLSARACRQVAEIVARGDHPLLREIESLCFELAEIVEAWVDDALPPGESGVPAAEASLPEEDLWAMRPRFDSAFVDYLEYRRDHKAFRAEDPFVSLYFDLLRFLDVMMRLDESFSTLATREREDDPRLRILCKDPSRFLGAVIRRTHSTVGLSATLSPFELYRDLLGFEAERTTTLSVPNPFPDENRCVVIDPSVETTYRQRPFHYDGIAKRLTAFAEAVPGNSLALFPSYAFLATVAERMKVTGKRVLVQQRSDSDADREAILHTLRTALLGDVLLLAVAGGVFAEGVDYPGEMLQAVAVVGPCLPALTLERELLKSYYQERFERGFEYAFVVPGMTRVVQAVGRLLRSPTDRGVIALLDRRFLASPYRRYLPADWLDDPDDPRCLIDEPAKAAARFFATAG